MVSRRSDRQSLPDDISAAPPREPERDVTVIVDSDGIVTDMAAAGEGRAGPVPRELIGTRLADLLPRKGREALGSALADALHSGKTVTISVSSSADRREILIVPLVSRRLLVTVGLGVVAPQCRKVESLIEGRFQSIFHNLPAGMALTAPDGTFLRVNPSFCSFLGYREDELISLKVHEVTHPADRQVTALRRDEACAGKTRAIDLEKRYLRKDGSTVWGHVSSVWFYDRHDAPIFSVALIQDITERKRVEGELMGSESKFAKAFQAAPTWLVISSLEDGRFIEFNEAFGRICGYRREEVIGRTAGELGIWEDPADRAGIVQALRHGAKVRDMEVRMRGRDGRIFVGLLSAELIEVNGEQRLLTLVNDITARKEMEEALKRGENHYRAIIEAFDGLIYICSPDYRIEFMNERLIRRTGRDATGESCYKALHDLESICPWCMNERVARGETARWEVQSPLDKRWYYVVNTPIDNPDGTVSKQALILDITERKLAEAALCESEEKFSRAFRAMPTILAITDLTNGVFIEVNEAFERTLGFCREELLGKSSLELGIWEKPVDRESYVQQLEADGTVRDLEMNFRGKKGETIVALLSGEIIELKGRKCLLSLVNDITARKRMEERIEILNTDLACRAIELEEANQELEAFSHTVSHDLRAPLTAIAGFSDLLLTTASTTWGEEAVSYLRYVNESSRRMDQLITALLDFSRVSRKEMHRENVDLSLVARDIAAELRLGDPSRQVEFLMQEGVRGDGDARLLRVVLQNLLGNAWKYTGKEAVACIEFGTAEAAGSPAYFVRDNGAGFDMTGVNRLFGTFQRLHTEEEFPGTGIGLATVARIVRRHGGRVWGEGAVGEGATFFFTLGGAASSHP